MGSDRLLVGMGALAGFMTAWQLQRRRSMERLRQRHPITVMLLEELADAGGFTPREKWRFVDAVLPKILAVRRQEAYSTEPGSL